MAEYEPEVPEGTGTGYEPELPPGVRESIAADKARAEAEIARLETQPERDRLNLSEALKRKERAEASRAAREYKAELPPKVQESIDRENT